MPKVLVAGIGNIFFGDDGFGVSVAERLLAAPAPDGVTIGEYGIRGIHLAFELLDGYDVLVLVDALPMGEPSGTVALFEPDRSAGEPGPMLDAHSMSPDVVLGLLAGLGGSVARVLVVGCEPESIDERIGLSDVVAAAVEPAVVLVGEVLDDICSTAMTAGGTR